MAELPCYLTESFGIVSQVHDVEERLSPCHPLVETDLRLLNYHGINCF